MTETNRPEPGRSRPFIKWLALAVFVMGGAAAGVVGYQVYEDMRKDDLAFAAAKVAGTREHFEKYLIQFPEGRHTRDAMTEIEDLEWAATPKTVQGLSTFLDRHPDSLRSPEVRATLEDMVWDGARKASSISALEHYRQQFPAGRHAIEADAAIEKMVSCNRAYAAQELKALLDNRAHVSAGSVGASNVVSSKQGAPSSTTYFSGNTATTYHHDGVFTSQDGVRVNYRVTNNSLFLVYREVSGTVAFRTKAGAFWRGVAGGLLGAAIGSATAKGPDANANEAVIAGAKKGYDAAKKTEPVTITTAIRAGESYSGSAYLPSKFKVLNSEFTVEGIRAEIDESLLRQRLAPNC